MADVRVSGTFTYPEVDSVDELFESLVDEDGDEDLSDVAEVVREGSIRKGSQLTLHIHASLTAAANVYFQDWLAEAAEEASDGQIDTWQDDFGDDMYIRVRAGGEEISLEGPFPGS